MIIAKNHRYVLMNIDNPFVNDIDPWIEKVFMVPSPFHPSSQNHF